MRDGEIFNFQTRQWERPPKPMMDWLPMDAVPYIRQDETHQEYYNALIATAMPVHEAFIRTLYFAAGLPQSALTLTFPPLAGSIEKVMIHE